MSAVHVAGLVLAGAGNVILVLALAVDVRIAWRMARTGRRRPRVHFGWYAAGDIAVTLGAILLGVWGAAGLDAVVTAIVVASWWRRRKRRDRAPRSLGAKSRALIAALVAKVRESARPRPVLRPVPQGAPS